MTERFPEDQHTTASLLRLARAYVEILHRPADAIPLFERIQLNPNAGIAEVQLARVGLGQAYMAAGDTTAARVLFDRMGADSDFQDGQGRAHYHLGQLDFMGGQFESAKRRLSAVAFEAPSASYTNDALDLALLLGEEMMDTPDEVGLRHYGRALYWETVGDDAQRLEELKLMARESSTGLRARARYELARYWSEQGETELALREIERLLTDDLGSRQVPSALELQGDILRRAGRENAALASYETLLRDHEGYIFMDEVRDKIRALQRGDDAAAEGELP
jgi:tetratricopeptide (TPR) repeat protein